MNLVRFLQAGLLPFFARHSVLHCTSLGREKVGALGTFHDALAGYNTFQMERNENGVEHVECVSRDSSRSEGAADVAGC